MKFVHSRRSSQSSKTRKKMNVRLKKILNKSVKGGDFIKLRSTNSRLFSNVYAKMGSAHDNLLLCIQKYDSSRRLMF